MPESTSSTTRTMLELRDSLRVPYTCAPGLVPRLGEALELSVRVHRDTKRLVSNHKLVLDIGISTDGGEHVKSLCQTSLGLTLAALVERYAFSGDLVTSVKRDDLLIDVLSNHALAASLTAHFSAGRGEVEVSLVDGIDAGGLHPNALWITLCFAPTGKKVVVEIPSVGAIAPLQSYFAYPGGPE